MFHELLFEGDGEGEGVGQGGGGGGGGGGEGVEGRGWRGQVRFTVPAGGNGGIGSLFRLLDGSRRE